MTFPLITMRCWYCEAERLAHLTRTCDTATEWSCLECGQRWNIRLDEPDRVYFFWPADIDAALDNDLQPLFEDS